MSAGRSPLRATLPSILLDALDLLAQHWHQVRQRLDACDARIQAHARADVRSVRAQQILGSAR